MTSITFSLQSNSDILNFIDKSVDNILFHNFEPYNSLQWFETSVKINSKLKLENIKVREMKFDIYTNIEGMKEILEIESNFLEIYQFSKPISDTLRIDHLPTNNRENILKQNGLKHKISVYFEAITISSFDLEFIQKLKEKIY